MGLGSIIAGALGGILTAGEKLIDTAFTSDEERLEKKNEFRKLIENAKATLDKEVSKRHENDMKSDSWMSKNIRPMTMIFLLIVYAFMSIGDGNFHWNEMEFTIEPEYATGYKDLLKTAFIFYFGSRGIEKSVKIYNDKIRK